MQNLISFNLDFNFEKWNLESSISGYSIIVLWYQRNVAKISLQIIILWINDIAVYIIYIFKNFLLKYPFTFLYIYLYTKEF